MIARFWFSSDSYIDSDIIKQSYSKTEVYYNELSPADNSMKFSVPFSVTIANALKTNINKNVRVEIIDSGDNLFTGYIRKSLGFSKTFRNNSISVELVSPSFILNKCATSNLVLTDSTVDDCLRAVLSAAGWTDIDPELPEITDTIPVFFVQDGDNFKEVLTELLFEYGYTFDFDAYGYFVLYPLFNEPEDIVAMTDGPDGNLYSEVVFQAQERRYDGIAASWRNCISGSELVFNDLSEHVSGDAVYDGTWHAEYSASKDIVWITDITHEITRIPNTMTATVTNNGLSASITFGTAVSPKVTKIAITGSGYFSTASNVTKVTDGDNLRTHNVRYCYDGDTIESLAKNVRDYYKYSGMTATFRSSEALAIGSFVTLAVEGQGTLTCRIIRKQTSLVNMTQYEAESVMAYTPAVAITTQTGTQYASGEAAAIVQQAQTLIHGVRQLASLDESGAYEDEVANYHGQLYTWKDSAWHLINRERYLGMYDHSPEYEEGSYFLASADFADPNGTQLIVDGVEELEVDDTVLLVAASFNKGSIYVGENGAWN